MNRACYLYVALLFIWAYWAVERISQRHAPLLADARAGRGG